VLDRQLITLMRHFNFSRAAAVLYSTLLINGPQTTKQLEIRTSIPHKHIEHGLNQLIALRLVNTDYQRDQIYYYATNPSIAWLTLATDLVWEVDDRPGFIRCLPETENQSIEGLRLLCQHISAAAQKLYKPYTAIFYHKERGAKSSDELAQLTCEAIYQAEKQILAVSRSPRLPQVSSFWAVLTSCIEKGVRYRRIVDLDELIDHGLSIILRDIEVYHIDLRVPG
jgi:sugar-specific transcriptional regulator TrmB